MTVRTFHSLDAWPKPLVRAVGRAYRQNGAEGTREPAGWQRIRDAYLAAGGDPATAATTPNQIIATLARVHPEWLHETAIDAEQPQRRARREARHRGSLEALRAIVRDWASAEPLIRHAWLYGSRAVGDPWRGSDVNLAVSIDPAPAVFAQGAMDRAGAIMLTDMDRRGAWAEALAGRLLQPVDLAVLTKDDSIVRPAVLREGVLLYSRRTQSARHAP